MRGDIIFRLMISPRAFWGEIARFTAKIRLLLGIVHICLKNSHTIFKKSKEIVAMSYKTPEEKLFEDGVVQICSNCGAALAFGTLGMNGAICPYCNGFLR